MRSNNKLKKSKKSNEEQVRVIKSKKEQKLGVKKSDAKIW